MNEVLLTLQIQALPGGGYLATRHELPPLLAQGRTVSETVEIAQDVARNVAESYIEHGDELPELLRGFR